MVKPCQVSATLQAIFGGLCVAMLAASHHMPIDEIRKVSLHEAAVLGILQSLVALVTFLLLPRLRIFGRLVMASCLFGQLLFTIPIFVMSFGHIGHTPTAPFGGTLFILSWFFLAIGIFTSKESADD